MEKELVTPPREAVRGRLPHYSSAFTSPSQVHILFLSLGWASPHGKWDLALCHQSGWMDGESRRLISLLWSALYPQPVDSEGPPSCRKMFSHEKKRLSVDV